jgi:hypothetical protein
VSGAVGAGSPGVTSPVLSFSSSITSPQADAIAPHTMLARTSTDLSETWDIPVNLRWLTTAADRYRRND